MHPDASTNQVSLTPDRQAKSGSLDRQLVVFGLGERRYALRLSVVEQIVRVVEITSLPKAPKIVLGVVNVNGRIVPVYNIRSRFRLPDREDSLSDHLIVARTARRAVALPVDIVTGVVVRTVEEVTDVERISPGLEYVEGVVKLEDGLVFIHDLDTFLSLAEEIQLHGALSSSKEGP
jgi:purine-binding chemotaxis protein CheW